MLGASVATAGADVESMAEADSAMSHAGPTNPSTNGRYSAASLSGMSALATCQTLKLYVPFFDCLAVRWNGMFQ